LSHHLSVCGANFKGFLDCQYCPGVEEVE